jgi:anti-sigma factor RsiW
MLPMSNVYLPIDVKALSRQALRGYGPEDPEPLAPRKRYRWLRRQPTERPRSIPVSPASSRACTPASSVPSSAR